MLDLPARYGEWARMQRLTVAPRVESPLCPAAGQEPSVAILEPRPRARYLWDPDTPAESAAIRLSAQVTPADLAQGSLYPPLSRVREVSAHIAAAVAAVAFRAGLATVPEPSDLLAFMREQMYDPRYPSYVAGA